jgi:hypothetical protein
MKRSISLMKKLITEGENYKPETKDEAVKGKEQAEIEVEVGKTFSEKSRVISRDIQRLIHESQSLSDYGELEAKVKEIEKYQEEKVYKKYQGQIKNLNIKLSRLNESKYREGVVKRIEDKLKEIGKQESDLTDKERNDLGKIKRGEMVSLNDIGEVENEIIARVSKSNFLDILNNLLKEANELAENVTKGSADKLQKLRKGLYNFQFSNNIYCGEVFETKKAEVQSALNQLESISYPEIDQEKSSLFRPEVIIPVFLISCLVIGAVLMIKKARRR